jgi:hypothetical protein
MRFEWILLFLFISCTSPTAPSHLFSKYRNPAQTQEGCYLKKHHVADVYKTFYEKKPLDEVWYDEAYAQKMLDEHKNSGVCP